MNGYNFRAEAGRRLSPDASATRPIKCFLARYAVALHPRSFVELDILFDADDGARVDAAAVLLASCGKRKARRELCFRHDVERDPIVAPDMSWALA